MSDDDDDIIIIIRRTTLRAVAAVGKLYRRCYKALFG